MKRILPFIALLTICISASAQTKEFRRINTSGEFPAIVANDASLPGFTIYRPENLAAAVQKAGPLPVVVFANGGCSVNPRDDENFNSEIASHGFILIGIGDYNPISLETYHELVKSLGEEVVKAGADTSKANSIRNLIKSLQPGGKSDPKQLTEAINWAQAKAILRGGEYYKMIDVDKIGIMGSSCGGVQALSVSFDTRIKTIIMKNSGNFKNRPTSMGGTTVPEGGLNEIKVPMLYMLGNETDVAYRNAVTDFEEINHIPVAFCSGSTFGHMGTVHEPYGGEMSRIVIAWLQYQFRADNNYKKVFTDKKVQEKDYPVWTIKSKNID